MGRPGHVLLKCCTQRSRLSKEEALVTSYTKITIDVPCQCCDAISLNKSCPAQSYKYSSTTTGGSVSGT